MSHRTQSPSEVAKSFRDDCCDATGSDLRVLRREREKAIAIISAFVVSVVFSVHVFVRSGSIELKDGALYILTFGLGLLSLVARSRMKRATEALDRLKRSHEETKRPNKAPEPTSTSVTSPASAGSRASRGRGSSLTLGQK